MSGAMEHERAIQRAASLATHRQPRRSLPRKSCLATTPDVLRRKRWNRKTLSKMLRRPRRQPQPIRYMGLLTCDPAHRKGLSLLLPKEGKLQGTAVDREHPQAVCPKQIKKSCSEARR